jgi:four helix bundle protein
MPPSSRSGACSYGSGSSGARAPVRQHRLDDGIRTVTVTVTVTVTAPRSRSTGYAPRDPAHKSRKMPVSRGHEEPSRCQTHELRSPPSRITGNGVMDRVRTNDLHKLDVYRCALELYRRIGRMVAAFPRGEADLRAQMRRASRSVPFNIGEGVGKRGRARAAAYEIALGETKELIVALDCVEIDGAAPLAEVSAAQDLADRIAAMLTKLISSAHAQADAAHGVP